MQRLTVTTIAVTENNQPACDWRRFPVKSYWRVEGSAGQAVAWPPKSIARRAGHGLERSWRYSSPQAGTCGGWKCLSILPAIAIYPVFGLFSEREKGFAPLSDLRLRFRRL